VSLQPRTFADAMLPLLTTFSALLNSQLNLLHPQVPAQERPAWCLLPPGGLLPLTVFISVCDGRHEVPLN
jgi:hypothetical protein